MFCLESETSISRELKNKVRCLIMMEMSQLLQYVHKIAPQEIHTFGKGSSSVGLTAYVTRDQETKQFMLEYDTLVLSDGGVCY